MKKLSKTDLRIIRAIYQGTSTLRELVDELDLSVPRVSTAVSRLEDMGFLEKSKRGRRVTIHFSDRIHMENLKQMFAKKLQVDRILSGSGLPILLTLMIPEMSIPHETMEASGLTKQEITLMSGLSRVTVHSELNALMLTGSVYRAARHYKVSKTMEELKSFLKNYSQYLALQTINDISRNTGISENKFIVQHAAGSEFVISAHYDVSLENLENIANLEPTAITKATNENLHFLSDSAYYHYSMNGRHIREEDMIIDMVLLNPSSPRYMSYALLSILHFGGHIKKRYLLQLARMNGILHIVKKMYDYLDRFPLEKNEVPKGFPQAEEFRELCALYGVRLNAE